MRRLRPAAAPRTGMTPAPAAPRAPRGRRGAFGLAVRALLAALTAVLLAGCATFPDDGPRDWQERADGQGELGGPPTIQPPPPPAESEGGGASGPAQNGTPGTAEGCDDPDPQVVETCLNPVGAIAVLPDATSALVGERATGRVYRVRRDAEPVLVTTVPVDATGGGGLTGLVLSPAYAEDQLVYAYATTPDDNRVLRLAPGEPPKPVLTGIPKGARNNSGALAVDVDGTLLVATGDAGLPVDGAAGLNGKILRIDTLGRPGRGNPDPASPVLSSGLISPGGICVEHSSASVWLTDHLATRDVLYLATPGQLGTPAWTWPDRPGVSGCVADAGVVTVALTAGKAVSVLRPNQDGRFTSPPETLLPNTYGQLSATAIAPDGLLWLGTANKAGGTPVSSDDRVIRIQPPSGGGESRS